MIRCGMSLKSLAFAVLAIVAVGLPPAHADQASKDPAVAFLRERFRYARAPKLEDLAQGQMWGCEYRSAEPDSRMHGNFPNAYRFDLTTAGTIHAADDALGRGYVFTPSALVGKRASGKAIFGEEHIRVANNGELLVEFALPECSGFSCLFGLVREASLDNPWEALIGYSECRL